MMQAEVSEELAAGMLVGRYQLLFRLGKGGMGEVWAAAQTQSEFGFQKLIALKVLRTREMQSNAAVMFFDEAKAASALQHQAIVSTVDLGRDDDILFIAMDMVRGPSLTALLQRLVINKRKMSPAIVAYIGKQIASALHYAHERATSEGQQLRLVHRDVSPHNVLLDLNGSIKLTDFGVARTTIQSHQSHVGTVRGKPSYMAPEQVAGADVDARTDIFALGIVLYESSCLKRLFGRSNPVKSMDAVMKHTPRDLTEMDPSYPPQMWAVIKKALEKKPEDRFQDAGELHDALDAASVDLEGAASASRDLVALVDRNFEGDAFDIDSRVHEVLAEVGSREAPDAGLPAPQRPMDDAPIVRGIEMPPGTKVAWPTAHAPDPLAPEAIEEARTQFRAVTPSASAAIMQSISVDALLPSSMDMTPAGTHSAIFASPPPRRNWKGAALAVSVAAVVMTSAAWVVLSARGSAPPDAQLVEHRVDPPRTVQTAPVEVSQKRAKPVVPATPPPAAVEKPEPAEEPARRPPPQRRAPARTPDRGVTKAAPEEKIADATYDEVLKLVMRVKRVDPDRGKAMYPTVMEAGHSNTKELNRIRAEARTILAKAGLK